MVGADAVADAYTVRYDDQDELALSATEVAKWLVLPSNKNNHTEARAKLARALDARAICSEEQATSQASHRREVSQALATAELMVSQRFYGLVYAVAPVRYTVYTLRMYMAYLTGRGVWIHTRNRLW